MSDSGERDRDEILRRVLTGELPEDAPEVVELLEEQPEAREELERMRALQADLDEAGGFVRKVLEEAGGGEGAPGEDAVEGFVAERTAGSAPERPGPRRWKLATVLAAAAAIVLILLLRDPLGPTYLGPPDVRILAPSEGIQGEEYGIFRWEYELKPGWEFEIIVRGAGMEERSSGRLPGSPWDPGDTHAWPDSIEWELLVHDNSGRSRSLATTSAWR